eukprot:2248720-Rhodomonas_salina.1
MAHATSARRADESSLAMSVMHDKVIQHNTLRAAMQVLNRHAISALATILLPDCRFKDFLDLPPALRADPAWQPGLYAALCDAVAAQVDTASRVLEAPQYGQRQLRPQTL